jgi:thiazole synthase
MWNLAGKELKSRLLLGTARYPSPEILSEAVKASETDVVTIALRRESPTEKAGARFWEMVQGLGVKVLPNTAGCRTAKEAITTALMARDLFETEWIKLEVIGDDYTLQPDTLALVEAAAVLIDKGFEVLPYTTEDLIVAQRLIEVGCRVVMPWGSYIGSGKGLVNSFGLETLRERLPDATLIVDAGLGKPSEAARAMEMGFDGVLVNSAVALAGDPPGMARAFARAVEAGRTAYESGLMPTREMAAPSTPALGTPFWHAEE